MRKLLITLALLLPVAAMAQNYKYTEASELTLLGKLMDTPNPYHRVDTVKYKGFTVAENRQVRMSSGISVTFRTNSKSIAVVSEYGYMQQPNSTTPLSARGYDLYIKKDGEWTWAGAACPSAGKEALKFDLIKGMDDQMKECLLYLPLFSEEYSVKIGVEEGSVIEAGEVPFKGRIALFGSSYTHGTTTARAGMTIPAQFTRLTGLQVLSLGCSGNSKLQQYYADVFVDAVDVDGFLIDGFSNPDPEIIKERLFPFIEKIQAAHPGKPIVFFKSLHRENRTFNKISDKNEQAKMDVADSLMTIAEKKYKDVYYVRSTNCLSKKYPTAVDGVHPSDFGYFLVAESVAKKAVPIFKKYGIKK